MGILGTAEVCTCLHESRSRPPVPPVGHEQVEKSRACNFDLLEIASEALAEFDREIISHLPRVTPERGREQHRRVGRVIAELDLRRALQARGLAPRRGTSPQIVCTCNDLRAQGGYGCGVGGHTAIMERAGDTRRRGPRGSVVVALAREDLGRAEELLQQNRARKLMRHRLWAERQALISPRERIFGQPMGSPDQETEVDRG